MAHAKQKRHFKGRPISKTALRAPKDPDSKLVVSRELLSAGLAAAAAAIAASPKSRMAIRTASNDVASSTVEAASYVMVSASKLGSLIAEAITEVTERALSGSWQASDRKTKLVRPTHLMGEGVGEVLSATNLQDRLTSIVDDENPHWASSELLGVLDAASRLGIARSTLDQWRRSGKVLAFSKGLRNYVFPMDQFEGSKPVAGLETIRKFIANDEEAWEWLVTPEKVLGDRKPLDLLKLGRIDQVVSAAEGVLDFA